MTIKTFVGDTGTEIILDCGQDISGAASIVIKVLKPNGESVVWPAVLEGTNFVKYESSADTFDVPGYWRLQVKATFASGEYHGEEAIMPVHRVLP